ncbi:hypothetical protein C8Q76DRAFT_857759 [Earliella scabrosa]|nr:hypothetical protein C8Q76DRAFT_857759 [Earliella scabrosa]
MSEPRVIDITQFQTDGSRPALSPPPPPRSLSFLISALPFLTQSSMWWPTVSDAVSSSNTLGVLLIATVIAAMLYGVTVLQGVQYYDRFYNDSGVSKFLVLVLGVFETMTIAMEIHALYNYAVAHADSTFATISIPSSLSLEYSFAYATVFLVQMFYAVRIQQLRRQCWWLAIITGILATAAIGTGLAATVKDSQYGSPGPSFVNIISTTSAGLQIGTDLLIVFSLYWLNKTYTGDHNRGAFSQFFVSAINRGVFSTALQIATTVTYFALRPRLVWLSFHMASSKVHAISLLSTLNSRTARDGVGHDPEIYDARVRERLERELGGGAFGTRLESPPNLPSIAYGLPRSPSSWFTNTKSTEGALDSCAPSYHARSITAVDGASGNGPWASFSTLEYPSSC